MATTSKNKATRSLRGRVSAVMAVLAVITTAGGVVLMTGATAQATPTKVHKSYVCKYVSTPGEGERLQTGNNPIWVDNSALVGPKGGDTYVGQTFKDGQERSVVIVANTAKLTPEPTVDDCPAPVGPEDKTVSPIYPSATDPTCSAAGTLQVPDQRTGVVVTGGGADGAGPGSYTFTYAPAEGYVFPSGTDTSKTVVVEPKLTGEEDCPTEQQPTTVSPHYPSANPPSCNAAGTLVAPAQPTGVTVSGGGANGAGPGSYTFTYAPASASYVFPQGTETSKTVTVLPQLTGEQCTPDETPALVTPNAPSQTEPTCTAAGTITAPAAQPGVVVAVQDLGNGAKKFISTPAANFTFGAGNPQSVEHTVTAKPRKTGADCAEVEGTDEGTGPGKSTGNGGGGEVAGTSAGRGPATVKGTSASVPNAIDAGLTGQQTDTRLLVGEALVGAGLLFFAASLWSGLGIRRRGGVQA